MTDEDPIVYVALLDEDIAVWRPVRAERIGGDVYRIVSQPYDAEAERWEFVPGDVVRCGLVSTSEGEVLAATGRADAD